MTLEIPDITDFSLVFISGNFKLYLNYESTREYWTGPCSGRPRKAVKKHTY